MPFKPPALVLTSKVPSPLLIQRCAVRSSGRCYQSGSTRFGLAVSIDVDIVREVVADTGVGAGDRAVRAIAIAKIYTKGPAIDRKRGVAATSSYVFIKQQDVEAPVAIEVRAVIPTGRPPYRWA